MPKILNPQELAVPKGYAHGVVSDPGGRVVCVAAQIGWDGAGKMVDSDMSNQFKQALKNVGSVLKAAGGHPDSILRMNIFITSKEDYLKAGENIGREYRAFMGKHSPAMTILVVKDLLEPGAKISVEVTASVNEKGAAAEFQRHGQGAQMPDAGVRGQGAPRPPPGGIRR
jgi:enamine deaminase RidA (YjgF/YER057c/UK114 family)